MTKFGGRGQEVMTRSPDCSEFDGFLPKDESTLFTSTSSAPFLCLQDNGQVGAHGPEDISKEAAVPQTQRCLLLAGSVW